ncbi:MAG: hypothetical protein RJA98_2794, partial [Pseudomonadota bacterium]
AQAFRTAAGLHQAAINPLVFRPPGKKPPVLDPTRQRMTLQVRLNPAAAMSQRLSALWAPRAGSALSAPAEPAPCGFTPQFHQAMVEPLARLSPDWLFPGLHQVPPNTVALLQSNPRFIEAFLAGLNTEMARELLWRDFPLSDPGASFFPHFWPAHDPRQALPDTPPMAQWGPRRLGENGNCGEGTRPLLVLLMRSALLQRYPGAIVYAVSLGDGPSQERYPVFRGGLPPDLSFFGFDLNLDEALARPGWAFVIQQQATDPHFGFDASLDFAGATHVSARAAPPSQLVLPAGASWGRNAAHMAHITRQQPLRILIHASDLLARQPG